MWRINFRSKKSRILLDLALPDRLGRDLQQKRRDLQSKKVTGYHQPKISNSFYPGTKNALRDSDMQRPEVYKSYFNLYSNSRLFPLTTLYF
jgi:hypothetical protein